MSVYLRIDINIVSMLLLGFVYWIAYKRLDRSDKTNRIFLNTSLLLLIQLFLETITCIFDAVHLKWLIPVHYAMTILLFMIGPLLAFLWCNFIYSWVVPDMTLRLQKHKALLIPLIINAAVALSTPFSKLAFTIDTQAIYHRGPFYFVTALATYFYLTYSILYIASNKKRIIQSEYLPLLLFGMLPAAGGFIQIIFYGSLLMWSSAAFSFVVVFIYLQQKMMQIDSMTGAWTRQTFDKYLEYRVAHQSKSESFGIIFIDVDGFKTINDKYGHFEGDDALKTIVRLLKDSLRKKDIIARFGGDEFVILIEGVTEEKLRRIKHKIDMLFAHYNENSKKPYRLEYSCGYGIFDADKYNIWQFINHVDHMMYANKEKRNKQYS